MPGIVAPIQSLLARLATLDVTNGDGNTAKLYSRIWNNQVKQEDTGTTYIGKKPAAYVEVIPNPAYETLGLGFKAADLGFKIHLVVEELDAGSGTMEQNVSVFDLRDKVDALLTLFEPTACGPMTMTSEGLDYTHTNIYHYVMDFVTHFINSKGSIYDTGRGLIIEKTPPTNLEVDVTLASGITTPVNYETVQPEKTLAAFYISDTDGKISIFLTDADGNSLAGKDIVQVQLGILPLPPKDGLGVDNWRWDKDNGFLNLLNGISLAIDQQLSVLYNEIIIS